MTSYFTQRDCAQKPKLDDLSENSEKGEQPRQQTEYDEYTRSQNATPTSIHDSALPHEHGTSTENIARSCALSLLLPGLRGESLSLSLPLSLHSRG